MYRQAQRYLAAQHDLQSRLQSKAAILWKVLTTQLELIYAYHGAFQNEAAIEAAERFIVSSDTPGGLCILYEGGRR